MKGKGIEGQVHMGFFNTTREYGVLPNDEPPLVDRGVRIDFALNNSLIPS